MDVSPVQSSAKCGSDFSIERILSSDSGSGRSPSGEPPSWLCCTRYQPPRLPRSVSSGCRSRRSGRHARVPFTAAQASALEAAYARAPYLAPPALRALAAALQLRDDRIKIWFQNRRARERREKSSTITPPKEVALPATPLFNPQGSLTSGISWSPLSRPDASASTSVDLSPSAIISRSPEKSSTISRLGFEEFSNTDYPRDLTVSTSSSISICDDDDTRPDSPLDIESVDD